jgi:imidazoleglycerol-phosphate dehydratase/histidinol-phosphatase
MLNNSSRTQKIAFIDRDGTLLVEPADFQLDKLNDFKIVPGAISGLKLLVERGYQLVLISNQDRLGTDQYPKRQYVRLQGLLNRVLASEGITFSQQFICPHAESDECACRKPKTKLLSEFLVSDAWSRERSVVIGDRSSDEDLAKNLGVRFFRISYVKSQGSTWPKLPQFLDRSPSFEVSRVTQETRVALEIKTGSTEINIKTDLSFFDHLLHQLFFHAQLGCDLSATGDLHIDSHHLIEDVAIVIGEALGKLLGDRRGLKRYGQAIVPMDEALAICAIDLAARSYYVYKGPTGSDEINGYRLEMLEHFFKTISDNARFTLHLRLTGKNTHHIMEVAHKAFGQATRRALRPTKANTSTKGALL